MASIQLYLHLYVYFYYDYHYIGIMGGDLSRTFNSLLLLFNVFVSKQ